MKHKPIRDVFIKTREITRGPKASVAGIALILLTAALLAIGQSNGTVDRAEITANGTFTSVPSADIGQQSVGDCSSAQPTHCLDILSRYSVNSFTGSLAGTSVSLQTIARDDVTEKKAFQTNTASFWGTLNGLNGGFSTIAHVVADRSQCVRNVTCPPSLIPLEGKLVLIEGTGTGELEGICGGGSLKSLDPPDSGTEYHLTLRFGKDCKASN